MPTKPPPRIAGVGPAIGQTRHGSAAVEGAVLVVLALLGLLLARPLHAATDRPAVRVGASESGNPEDDEYWFKAAYVLKILGYTTWPKDAFEKEDSPIRILIVGKDPFGEVIDETFRDKRIGKRPIEIKRAKTLPEEPQANVVYCALAGGKERAKLIAALAKRPVLLFGETPGFAASGGAVNFYLEDKKLKFEINPDAVKQSGLTLSSQLLKLAKIVKTKKEEEKKKKEEEAGEEAQR